jgi:hypothetical protein
LNDVGLRPFLALEDHLLNIFEPFDINPAPEAVGVAGVAAEWRGSYEKDYELPEHLLEASEMVSRLKSSRHIGKTVASPAMIDIEEALVKEDKERIQKLTTTLAYLHSRGESASGNPIPSNEMNSAQIRRGRSHELQHRRRRRR